MKIKTKTVIITLLTIIIASAAHISYAEYEFVEPNWALLDENKKRIQGVTKSKSSARCIQKADEQKSGTYYCRQVIEITVTSSSNKIVNLSWVAPTENTDNSKLTNLAGSKVRYGIDTDKLSNIININNPLTTSLEVADLTPNTYYFAVSAVNSLGVESDLSTIEVKVIE